jgi:hypothetical protein
MLKAIPPPVVCLCGWKKYSEINTQWPRVNLNALDGLASLVSYGA